MLYRGNQIEFQKKSPKIFPAENNIPRIAGHFSEAYEYCTKKKREEKNSFNLHFFRKKNV